MSRRDSYPHPVLGHLDDVNSTLKCNFSKTSRATKIDIKLTIETNDADLQTWVGHGDDGLVSPVISWMCSSTLSAGALTPRLTNVVTASESEVPTVVWTYSAELDQNDVRGTVDVDVLFVLNRASSIRWAKQHQDYGEASFSLGPRDVVADCGRRSFHAEKRFDPLAPPDSWFKFQGAGMSHGLELSLADDEHIYVRMPHAVFSEFKALSGNPELQTALFALPALVAAVEFIKDCDRQGITENARWYPALKAQIERTSKGLEGTSLSIAQELLEFPVDRYVLMTSVDDEEE